MAVDAASGWILDELEEGNQVPQASRYEDVEPKENGQVNLLLQQPHFVQYLNVEEYLKAL